MIIADDPGLGKTIEALATLQSQQAFPALVVCPASVKLQWEAQAREWLPGRSVSVLNVKTPDYFAEIIICNYDILAKHADALKARGLKAVVIDESHMIKTRKAKRSRAVKELAAACRLRLALTGTPIMNRPAELIHQLDVLGRLSEFGGFWGFANRYCQATRTRFGLDISGAANLPELNERLRSFGIMIRRTKDQVLKELPPSQTATVMVEISNHAEYARAEEDVITWLRGKATEDAKFLASIQGLEPQAQAWAKHQRANDASEKARRAQQLVRIEALKQIAAWGKLEAVTDWVENFLESGKKLVVFAWHREIVDAIADRFSCPKIFGGMSLEDRRDAVAKFQGEARIITLNMQSGGTGLDGLQHAASDAIFIEQGWNPATHDQAISRLHRMGQESENPVTGWFFIGQATIDVDIFELVAKKQQIVVAATDGKETKEEESEGVLSELIERILQKK